MSYDSSSNESGSSHGPAILLISAVVHAHVKLNRRPLITQEREPQPQLRGTQLEDTRADNQRRRQKAKTDASMV